MLRLFLASAARTNSRSLLGAQSNKSSVYVSIRGTQSTPKEPGRKFTLSEQVIGVGGVFVVVTIVAYIRLYEWRQKKAKEEAKEKLLRDRGIVHINVNSTFESNRAELEKGLISFGYGGPSIHSTSDGTYVYLNSNVIFKTPNITGTSDYRQVCEELGRRGFHVECSEEGARLGLAEFIFEYMKKGAEEQLNKIRSMKTSTEAPPTSETRPAPSH